MKIFAILSLEDITAEQQSALDRSIKNAGGSVYDDYAPKAWFMTFEGTTEQLSEELSLGDDYTPSTIVFPIANFRGFAEIDFWEWLAVNEK